uniref:Uncharacterized protein n=1 Tax=Heliothis virescens TaxID=7102 RepID=A0A2A4JZ97_HELVI
MRNTLVIRWSRSGQSDGPDSRITESIAVGSGKGRNLLICSTFCHVERTRLHAAGHGVIRMFFIGAGNGGGPGGAGGVGGAGGTSEYVRNELRAVVGARARPELHALQPPDMDSLMSYDMTPPGGGSVVGGRASSASTNSWESQQSTPASLLQKLLSQ